MFKKEKDRGPRQVNYLWVLAGGYLIYLGYKILRDQFSGVAGINMAIAIISSTIFIAVGIIVMLREWKIYRHGDPNYPIEEKLDDMEEKTDEEEIKE